MNKVTSVSSRTRRDGWWVGLGGLASGVMLTVSALHGITPVHAQTISVPAAQVEDRGDDRLVLNHDARLDDVFAQGLDDRQVDVLDRVLHLSSGTARLEGMDDILRQAQGIGLDDRALADMLLGIDIQQEDRAPEPGDVRQEDRALEPGDVRQDDRQEDRALEVGDDRLAPQADQQMQPGDVRQEDRQNDRAAEVGDDRLTRPAEQQVEHATVSSGSNSGSSNVTNSSSGSSSGSSSSSSGSSSSGKSTVSAPATTSAPAKSSSSGSGSSGSGSSGHSGGGHDDAGGHH
jgi:hypothetical protein